MAGNERPQIESREYKVVVNATLFDDVEAALPELGDDLRTLVESLGLEFTGGFDAEDRKEQTIRFLDTRDFTLRDNTLLLRQRVRLKNGKTEYTLKCRSADRYFSQARDLKSVAGFKAEQKFEEDISAPFASGFSKSNTIEIKANEPFAGDDWPRTLSQAARLFPILQEVEHDGLTVPGKTPLETVNAQVVHETLNKGPRVQFPDVAPDDQDECGEVALIVWRKSPEGRGLTAELSFRVTAKDEQFQLSTVVAARQVFNALQRQDWVLPDAKTKTQFMYEG